MGLKKSLIKNLGIKSYEFGNKLCTQFDKYPLLTFVRVIEKRRIQKFKPEIIFTHSADETNIDHISAYKSTMIACRPDKKSNLEFILEL